MSLQDVDWRSPREDGVPVPVPVRLFDVRAKRQEEQQQVESFHRLGEALEGLGNHDFASVLRAAAGPFSETKLGPALVGSPLSYQQARVPSGFKTWVSGNIPKGAGKLASLPELFLFDGAPQHQFLDSFSADEWSILTVSTASQIKYFSCIFHAMLKEDTGLERVITRYS